MVLVSVITINKNNSVGLQKTINSVINQVYKYFEFIVIDGNSDDESKTILIANDSKITKWVSEPDNGIYDAQNKGIQKATGKYLLFLNSGDSLVNRLVLENVSQFLSGDKSIYYGDLILEKNNLQEKHLAPNEIDADFMLNSTFWHPCVFIRAELFKDFGLYNTDFKIVGDYEFFIRCLLKPDITTEHIQEFITLFDGNGISNDVSQSQLQTEERERAWKQNISATVYGSLKKQNAFSRSKYASVINLLQKMRGKQNF